MKLSDGAGVNTPQAAQGRPISLSHSAPGQKKRTVHAAPTDRVERSSPLSGSRASTRQRVSTRPAFHRRALRFVQGANWWMPGWRIHLMMSLSSLLSRC
jgi:hypothetical protein